MLTLILLLTVRTWYEQEFGVFRLSWVFCDDICQSVEGSLDGLLASERAPHWPRDKGAHQDVEWLGACCLEARKYGLKLLQHLRYKAIHDKI